MSDTDSEDFELNTGFSFEAGAEPTGRSWDYSFAIPRKERQEIEQQMESRRARVAIAKRKYASDSESESESEEAESGHESSASESSSTDERRASAVKPKAAAKETPSASKSSSKQRASAPAAAAAATAHAAIVRHADDDSDRSDESQSESDSESGSDADGASSTKGELARSTIDAVRFDELNLSKPLLKAIQKLGYEKATPIQSAVIPIALQGKDILASAVTGSGKTAAFMLPILERLLHRPRRVAATRVLVLLPTRELAVQCVSMTRQLASFMDVRVCLIVGGLALKPQEAELRTQPDIVVATPGRMADHLRNSLSVAFEDIEVLVLDEADRLLDMGFRDEVTEVVRACPTQRQTMLFSATLTRDVDALARLSLRAPVEVAADPLYGTAARLTQEVIRVRSEQESTRSAIVLALCRRSFKHGVVVFVGRRLEAHRLALTMELAGLLVAELHGDMTQAKRLSSLEDFRQGRVQYLVATDIAARGLDIQGVQTVINMYMPQTLREYVHRVGRTARAGREGRAVTLVGDRERKLLKAVIKHSKNTIKSRSVPREVIDKHVALINALQPKLHARLQEERAERELAKAEMQATKARNLLEHAEEIHSRPARTWMISEAEKKRIKAASREEIEIEAAAAGDEVARKAIRLERMRAKISKMDQNEDGGSEADAKGATKGKGKKGKKGKGDVSSDSEDERKRDKMSGKSRKQRRAAAARAAFAEGGEDADRMQSAQARTAKKEERRLRALGIRHRPIDKEAARKHRRERKQQLRRAARVSGSGEDGAGRVHKPPKRLVKGRHAFKSKARHKRRK